MRCKKEYELMIKTLSLEEKVSLMSGSMTLEEVRGAIQKKLKVHYNEEPYRAGGLKEKGIPPVFFADGPRGVVCGRGRAVCFPVSMMRGAAFDPELEEQIGEAMAEEVLGFGGTLFAGVCVNLPYHPGWGRCQETYGEDPCLLGEMGAALTRGIQKKGVIACVKHYAFNSMENSRFKVNISCSRRAEREVYLPHFKKCIDAGAGAVMSAYNSYRGVMCGHNSYLLKEVLKKEWGFDGFVMSDFTWGVKDTEAAANGGLDMEMPVTQYYGERLVEAVKSGRVKENVIDEAVMRIVRTLLSFQTEERGKNTGCIGSQAHIALALQCAREGITLLRNRDNILPLRRKRGGWLLVLGRLADTENTGDKGSSQVYPPYVVTPLQGIRNAASGMEVVYYAGDSPAHCRRLAAKADAVVIVAGNDHDDEGEYVAPDKQDVYTEGLGGDRQNGLGLHQKDKDMIRAVSDVRSDAVVVMVGGSMIMVSEWEEKVGAILLAYYSGMEGGTALGEVLFGKVNPGGKLPFVIPEKEDDLPKIDWDASEQTYEYYHGYTLLDKKGILPRYPFGFGLSYTEFQVSGEKAWIEHGRLCGSVIVENIGKRSGSEVIQMYIGLFGSVVEYPHHVLKAFQRVSLRKGERKSVTLSCDMQDLAWYDENTGSFVLEHGEYEVYLGTSSALKDLKKLTVGY